MHPADFQKILGPDWRSASIANLKGHDMKYAGLLVMPAGFFLTIAALVLFPDPSSRAAFVVCGLLVEGMGLFVAVRGHMPRKGESQA